VSHAHFVFLRCDPAGDRRLRAEQFFRREPKAFQPCGSDEGFQKLQVHPMASLNGCDDARSTGSTVVRHRPRWHTGKDKQQVACQPIYGNSYRES
jgi:hypothetical protein